jgi:hypothetical protein
VVAEDKMSNIDEESKRYKNISRQEIELLSGLEQEKAQMISGIHLSHKRTLKTVAESPKVTEYIALFGHRPAVEAYKFLTPEALEKKAKDALEKGEPIVSWRDRHKVKTGTLLDDLYG